MTFILNILISLGYFVAVIATIGAYIAIRRTEKYVQTIRSEANVRWRFYQMRLESSRKVGATVRKELQGELSGLLVKATLAEKMADRAFNMASTANLGVVALQKSLAVPRSIVKKQAQQNVLAKENVDKLFSGVGGFDWLRPLLSEEELDIIDKAEEHTEKFNGIPK
jgi:hypothetical protein